MPDPQPPTAAKARIIHAAMMAGVTLFAVITVATRNSRPAPTLSSTALLYGPFVLGAICFSIALLLSGKLPQLGTGTPENDWWRANQGRAIGIWALIEGPALFGIVVTFVMGSYLPLVVTAAGLLLYLVTAPGRLVRS